MRAGGQPACGAETLSALCRPAQAPGATRTAEADRRARRRLFAELQLGPRYSADPTPLASVLNLDHAVQQARRWQVCSFKRSLLQTQLADLLCNCCRTGRSFSSCCSTCWRASCRPLRRRCGANRHGGCALQIAHRSCLSRRSCVLTEGVGRQGVRSLVPTLFRGSYVYETVCLVRPRPWQLCFPGLGVAVCGLMTPGRMRRRASSGRRARAASPTSTSWTCRSRAWPRWSAAWCACPWLHLIPSGEQARGGVDRPCAWS